LAAKRPDPTPTPQDELNLRQLDALVKTYRVALRELRSWRDPRLASLIASLEALLLTVTRERRYRREAERVAKLL
jgi:hypothetical protein